LEKPTLTNLQKRWLTAIWLLFIVFFALLHALHLSADFPNHTPWFMDWAKYTDEGWYGNAAIRAHLFGNWYLAGDFNPAPALPLWPFLEWVLFFFTGVTIEAARGLAVAFFFVNLLLSYLLLRSRGQRWMALLAVTLLVASPFLYCFSRLAILEPMLIAFTLAALNLAVRLDRVRRPVWASVAIGLLFTLMMLTKTTALFLLPAVGWAMLLPLWRQRPLFLRCAAAAGAAALRRRRAAIGGVPRGAAARPGCRGQGCGDVPTQQPSHLNPLLANDAAQDVRGGGGGQACARDVRHRSIPAPTCNRLHCRAPR